MLCSTGEHMTDKITTYVPEDQVRRAPPSLLGYLAAALLALAGHHYLQPHGEVLTARVGTTVALTRTTSGWMVETSDGRHYLVTRVRVHAQDRQ